MKDRNQSFNLAKHALNVAIALHGDILDITSVSKIR
jgi:hypothetical protein